MGTRLFVGNISFKATEDSLRELFEQQGQVKDCHIVMDRETNRSKGFAFVEMSTQDEATEAIAKLETNKPDWVLLDLNLPDSDGWDVLHYIAGHPALKDVQVLIISGAMLNETQSAEIQTREYAFINKGEFKVDRVLATVADLLEVD